MLTEGTPAPTFTLPDHTGVTRTLDDYRGRWLVLWWYPRACSEVCSVQGRGLAPVSDELERLGASIVGISFDSPADNARFAAQEGMSFPLLSDESRSVARAYDVMRRPDEPYADAPRRVTYLISPDATILAVYQVQDAAGHGATLVEDIRSIAEATG